LFLISCDLTTDVTTTDLDQDRLSTAVVEKLDGDGQEVEVGTMAAAPIVVRVTDAGGVPLSDAPLSWTFFQGRGFAVASAAQGSRLATTTGPDGLSSVQWEAGVDAGEQYGAVEISTAPPSSDSTEASGASPIDHENPRKIGLSLHARAGSPDSVGIDPNPATVLLEGAVQFNAVVTDRFGNTAQDFVLDWESSDPAVASVDSSGLVTPVTVGTSTVTASTNGISGSSMVFVQDSDGTTPQRVTDLSLTGTTTSSVTVTWTEVGDGTGMPAKYALRYGTPQIRWWEAHETEVSIPGVQIGSTAEYEVTGLAGGSPYELQLVTYRGTLNVDAQFGALSNVAAATTEGSGALSPGIASASAGDGLVVLSATDASGGAPPYSYQWHRSTTSPFTPDAGNAIAGFTSLDETDTGLANGTTYHYRLVVTDYDGSTATYGGVSRTPRVPSALHPNEPGGMTEICNADGSIAYNANGAFGCDATDWSGHIGGGEQNVSTRSDPGNPTGSGSYVHFDWSEPGECCIADIDVSPGAAQYDTLYVAIRLFNYSSSPSDNKIAYFVSNNGGAPGNNFWTHHGAAEGSFNNREVGVANHRCFDIPSGDQPNELLLEWVVYHESAAGMDDGTVLMYFNGEQGEDCSIEGTHGVQGSGFTFNIEEDYDTWFSYLHIYRHHNARSPSSENNVSTAWREIYISGRE
jgi:hypothetical protein